MLVLIVFHTANSFALSFLRCFYTHIGFSKPDCLTVFVFTPILLQSDGDGGFDGAAGEIRGAYYCSAGQLIHTSQQRHYLSIWT